MAANLVEVERWRLRQAGVVSLDAAREMNERTPRRHTRGRIAAVNRRAKAARDRDARLILEQTGQRVDLETGEILSIAAPPPTD